jgi:hypothetical protein
VYDILDNIPQQLAVGNMTVLLAERRGEESCLGPIERTVPYGGRAAVEDVVDVDGREMRVVNGSAGVRLDVGEPLDLRRPLR